MNQYFYLKPEKNKLALETQEISFVLSQGGFTGTSSVKARGTQSGCQNTGEAAQELLVVCFLDEDMGWSVCMWEVSDYD